MAFLVVPVAGGAIGGLAGVGLSWSYTKAANATAKQLYGRVMAVTARAFIHNSIELLQNSAGLHEAYPWPIYKPWFDHRVKSNATNTGTITALLFGGVAFG